MINMIKAKPFFFWGLVLLFVMFLSLSGQASSFFTSLELSLEQEIGRNSYENIIAQKKVVELPAAERDRKSVV